MDERIAPQQLKKGYDCVVIGAGNGGLGAAAQLAAKGAKVLVLEQHSVRVASHPVLCAVDSCPLTDIEIVAVRDAQDRRAHLDE